MKNNLIEFYENLGYQNVRILQDGTICATSELIFTRALYIGLTEFSWEKRFCFEDRKRAIEELLKLEDQDSEPTGYIARRQL